MDVRRTMFADYYIASYPTTSTSTIRILDAVAGVLTKYPQNATPTQFNNNGSITYNLRVAVTIEHIELVWRWVGSQGTTLTAGDLYNTARFAVFEEGTPYDSTTFGGVPYLTGVVGGTNITDVETVFMDNLVPLSSTAFDSSTGYNVPRAVTGIQKIPINRVFNFYSTTDVGVAWKSDRNNLLLDLVSDSSVSPHPFFSATARIFFRINARQRR